MVNIASPQEMAHAAGFTGQRATYTWTGRMQLLEQLKFIDIKPGKYGAISHVLIWNPHLTIRDHYARKTPGLIEGNYNALLGRAVEIGANDMVHGITPPTSSAPASSSPPAS